MKKIISYDELSYYVYMHDFNQNKIKRVNVFNAWGMHELLDKESHKRTEKRLNKAQFTDELMKFCMYNFWSKCQYEILFSGVVFDSPCAKIDVYDQIKLNQKYFVDQAWNYVSQHWRNKEGQ